MEKIWQLRIKDSDRLFSNCPNRYKEKVLLLLKEDVEKGLLQEEEYNRLIEQ